MYPQPAGVPSWQQQQTGVPETIERLSIPRPQLGNYCESSG
jgi:hypothetical protein